MNYLPDLLDTKLLRILDCILKERSITTAANKLCLSQPAVSTALRQLRLHFNDPLVIISGKKLVLSERAEKIQPLIQQILEDITKLVENENNFNPTLTNKIFRLASPDNLSPDVIADLFARLRRSAPLAKIELHSFGPDFDPFIALENGRFDLVLGNWNELPENLHYHPLYQDEIVCLMRQNHPLSTGELNKQTYLASEHVAPARYAVAKSGVVDTYLSRHRLQRNVMVTVPFFNLAPYVLLDTDLIFTVNRSMAKHFTQYLPLIYVNSPLPFPPITYMQLWHERTHRSSAYQWLREQIVSVTANHSCNPKILIK